MNIHKTERAVHGEEEERVALLFDCVNTLIQR